MLTLQFGDGDIHSSELLRLLGTEMNSHHLISTGFLEELMESKIFQGWYRLSLLDQPLVKWFHAFATVDELELNTSCQNLLRTLFSLLENSFHGLNVGFEKAFLDYLMSEEFKELYEKTLPLKVRGNRAGAIYLFETLKTIFEGWYYDDLTELIVTDSEDESDEHLDHETFTIMTQRMVGGAVPKLRFKFGSPMARTVINSMGFQQFMGEVDQHYIEKYVPPVLQHSDKGGLSLIKPAFFPFARELMKFCQDANSDKSIYKNRRDWISDGLTKIRKHETLLLLFKDVVLTLHGSVHPKLIRDIFKQTAEYTMWAFSKRTNRDKFNTEKCSSTDTSNVKFRTLMQTGSNPSGNKSRNEEKRKAKKRSLKVMMTAVIAKHAITESSDSGGSSSALSNLVSLSRSKEISSDIPSTESSPSNKIDTPSNRAITSKISQRTSPATVENNSESSADKPRKKARRTDDDFKAFYHDIHQDALAKIDQGTHKLGRLSIKVCCAIFFVSFGIFHRDTKISATEVRAILKTAIDSKLNWIQVACQE